MIRIMLCTAVLLVVPLALTAAGEDLLDSIAEAYVKLALRIGQYDTELIDSYFGPAGLKPTEPPASTDEPPYREFQIEIETLLEALNDISTESLSDMRFLRYEHLERELIALRGRLAAAAGDRFGPAVEPATGSPPEVWSPAGRRRGLAQRHWMWRSR